MTSFYEELRKSDAISDEKENAQSRANIDKWIFRLLLFLIGFMPLVVMANVEEVISPLVSKLDVLSSGAKGDLFTHYKALLILFITIITGALFLVKVLFLDGTIHKTFLNYVLSLFVIAIVISTIVSPNIFIALNGQYNRSDGAISWVCYVTLMFIAMNIEYPRNVVKYVMYTMMPFVYINFFIITMNFYDKDLLINNAWMQSLVSLFLPEGANISEGSHLVGTLNQWNYMSGMFAILTGMYLTWAIVEKSIVPSVITLLTSLVTLSIMLMSLSTSGFVTVSILMLIILYIALKSENKAKGLILIVSLLVMIMPVFHILAEKNPRVWSESIGFILKENPYVEKSISAKEIYNFSFANKVYATESALELPIIPESGISAGTGRTYIWGKTLELVQDRPLIGYGLDSILYNFPHYNIDARGSLRTENTIVDKPHNVYVGILYGTGLIGFLGFILIIVYTVLISLKELFTKKVSITSVLIIAWFGYLVQAIFNDSLPSVTSIMWLLAGVLVSLIFLSKKDTVDKNL